MWEFDLKNEKWTQRTAMKTARAMAASATVGSSIYVAGGMQQTGEYLRSVERYDTLTRRWVEVAPMRVARTRFAMVNCNGHLFAIGGLSGKSDRAEVFNADTVEEYDPKTNKWSEAGRLQVGRHGFAACVAENRLYILGGYVGSSSTLSSTCECFDPKQRVSRLIPSLPSARGFHAAVALGGVVVCFGGRPPGEHPCRYDPTGKRWIDLGQPDVDLNRFVTGVRGDSVISVGGESSRSRPLVQYHVFSVPRKPKQL
jgi:hypothetical protein